MYYFKLDDNNNIIGKIMSDVALSVSDIEVTQEEYSKSAEYAKFNPETREFSSKISFVSINLDEYKQLKVNDSKEMLANWLEQHPLGSDVHNSENAFYSVTESKQSLLNQAVMTAQLKINLGMEPDITWNSTSNVCEPWTMDELVQLALQIEAYVKPKIKMQQTYEVQINACTSIEEVEAIEIKYDTV